MKVLGSLGGYQEMTFVGDASEVNGLLWLCLFCGIMLQMPYLAFKLFTPFEALNIFMLSVVKMIRRDLMQFLVLFGYFMLAFYFGLFVLYPRAGIVYLPLCDPFNNWYNAIRALFELAFTGSPSIIQLEVDFSMLSTSQTFDFVLWMVVYVAFVLILVVLLLNLLIAMLSFTFETVRTESTLQCRTAFAQALMRLELDADVLGMPVRVGEKKGPDTYVYEFRSVIGAWEGANDPFAGGSEENIVEESSMLAQIVEKLDKLEQKIDRMEAKADRPAAS